MKRLIRILIILSAWTALILQLYVLLNNVPDNGLTYFSAIGRFFIFFTILTNLLVALSVTVPLLNPRSSLAAFFTRTSSITAITVYILIVGIVYNLILRPLWSPEGLQKICDELLHVVVPILYIIYWTIAGFSERLKWSHGFLWLAYPFVYLVYALVRGKIEGFYPYPFIDAGKLPASELLLNISGMMLLFLLTGAIFIFINRKVKSTINN